jgi:hypothetical protein
VALEYRSGMENCRDPISFGVEGLLFQFGKWSSCQENAAPGKEGIGAQGKLCFYDRMKGWGLGSCARGVVKMLVPCKPEIMSEEK